MNDFKICEECDFEWHLKDGNNCPLCSSREAEYEKKGGAFGTGENSSRWKMWYQAIGLVALVYLIYQFVLGGG